MTSWVCIDANVVLKLYLNEEFSEQADALWTYFKSRTFTIVAPPLAIYEIAAVLRQNVYRGVIDPVEGREVLAEVLQLGVATVEPVDLHRQAYDLATRFNLPTAYDANYLVVAQALGCEFWTATAGWSTRSAMS
jgi:predicted nucleic acid-binding protein